MGIYVGFMSEVCRIYVGFMSDMGIYVGFMSEVCRIYVGFMSDEWSKKSSYYTDNKYFRSIIMSDVGCFRDFQ